MADTNQESQQLAETLAKLRLALDDSSSAIDKRRDQEMKAKHGVENFTAGTAKAAGALGALGGAGMAAASAMLKGEKGAAAFNQSVDGMADAAKMAGAALTLLIPGGPIIKGLIAGLTLAATAVAEYTKAANTMSDQLLKGYQGLAKSGAAASDGMTGLFKDAKKLGMSMNELDGYGQLVGENSRDLALFSGSVYESRKRFADLGKEMEPFRAGLMNVGIGMEEQREGTMAYIRLQTRMGMAQNRTTEELAQGARRYLLEQDALTKITGQTRKEMQADSERALQQQQFASKIRQLEMDGTEKSRKAAAELMKMNSMLAAAGPKVQAAFQASVTGNLANADAIDMQIVSGGELMRTSALVASGQMSAAEATQRTAKASGEFNDKVNVSLSGLNAGIGDFAEQEKLRQLSAGKGVEANLKAAEEERKKQGEAGKAADGAVQAQTDLRMAQIAANNAMESFIFKGIVPATDAMTALARATGAAAEGVNNTISGKGRPGSEQDKDGYYDYQRQEMEQLGQKPEEMGSFWKKLFGDKQGRAGGSIGATGKLIEDFGAGTPMMLHGKESVITEAQLNNLVQAAMGGSSSQKSPSSGDSGQTSKLQNLNTKMLKDTEQLAKITDSDVRRAREFSRINIKLTDLKTQVMEDEIELLEEQNKMLADIEEIYSKTMGPEAAKAAVKAFKRTQMMSNAAMPAAGGDSSGVASAAPTATGGDSSGGASAAPTATGGPSAPSEVEGAKGGGPTAKASEVLDFTARSGSASAFEGLNSRLKDSVISAAEEYHAATGNKFQINSAKRDPADQQRLWEQSVALGTPGRGPSGMAVAKPGRSPHEHGLAVDIQNYKDPAAVAAMNRQGLKQKVPGDPVHFSFGDGGVANGPSSGYLAELHGPEAVVPLPDGKTIPVRIEGDMPGSNQSSDMSAMMNQFKSSMESMINQMNNRDLLNMMDEMVRAQKASNSIQEKLLRAAAS
jgi:hypothetical protein